MAETTSTHIADDPGRLEEFVLGRLGAAECADAETHAASCNRCTQAIRHERMLAAGTKSFGRTLLRDTLRRRIAQEEAAARVPWPKILSAAAVIVLLVGVGWLNNWFLAPEKEPGMLAGKAIETTTPPAVSPADAPSRADKKSELPAALPGEKMRAADDARPSRRNEPVDLAAAETRNSVAISQDLKIAAAAPAPSGGVWVEGNAIAEGSAAGAYRGGSKDGALMKRKSDALAAPEKEIAAPAGAAKGMTQSAQAFRVQQQPAATLPVLRQKQQEKNAPPGTIQTLVEQKPGETVLTLYLDSLRNPLELRDARVEQVARDSIIVNIGNRRIGYRLPGMIQQEQAK